MKFLCISFNSQGSDSLKKSIQKESKESLIHAIQLIHAMHTQIQIKLNENSLREIQQELTTKSQQQQQRIINQMLVYFFPGKGCC